MELSDKFWNKVNKTDSCWLWTGTTSGLEKYTKAWYEGKSIRADFLAYKVLVGEIPKDSYLKHTCNNNACVNPDHLYILTKAEQKANTLQNRKEYKLQWSRDNKESIYARRRKLPQEVRKQYQIKYQYNISYEEYLKMIKDCDNTCSICGYRPKEDEKLCIDHNHNTKQVRGLLCKHCNWVIGHARECTGILNKSIDYLNKWKEN